MLHLNKHKDKFKQSKPDEFFHDFDLYKAPRGDGQPSTVGFQLPDIFHQIVDRQERGPNFEFKSTSRKSSWTKAVSDLNTTQKRVHEVTKNLISIYKQKRMRVFHNMARTQAALRSKEFFRIYVSPSEALTKKKVYFRSKFHPNAKPKGYDYRREYEKLRGLKESEEELEKVQKLIDKIIEKNIKKIEAKKKKEEASQKIAVKGDQYTTLTELVKIYFKDFRISLFRDF